MFTDYKSFLLSSYYCIFELTTSQNQIKMKKKQVLLAVFAATMLTPTVAWAVSYKHLRAHETRGNLVCRLMR